MARSDAVQVRVVGTGEEQGAGEEGGEARSPDQAHHPPLQVAADSLACARQCRRIPGFARFQHQELSRQFFHC